MKFLLSWLREFIELSVPPESLATRLTMAGLEVTALARLDGDWLFEVEVTPNRPDLLSHLGIARETAAILGRPLRFPRWLQRDFHPPRGEEHAAFPVTIEDAEGCRRYVGIVIEGVRVAQSPPELAERLRRIGIRPVNNIVDITNACMLELGQPLHAFDLDTLEGEAIRVRRAKAGEALVTIDGQKCLLTPDLLVIADSKRPVALAGVMGGFETQITPSTRRILLESAGFQPALIRRATRIAKLSSESSYRFERGVDLTMVPLAALRAARQIVRLAGGTLRIPISDVGQMEMARRRISLRPRKAQEILGMRISSGQQRRSLERLGCRVRGTGRGLSVEPPSWRNDLKIPEDLYEEVARLFGYDRCPETLPPTPRRIVAPSASSEEAVEDPWVFREARIKEWLVSAGAQEICTYSLVSPGFLSVCRLGSAAKIRNPLSAEQACLRPSLVCGALDALSRNLRRRTASSFCLFEMGHVFFPAQQSVVSEKNLLSLLVAGTPEPVWGVRPEPLGLFHLKGIANLLSERLGLGPLEETVESGPAYLNGPAVILRAGQRQWGAMGVLSSEVLAGFEIPAETSAAYAELDLDLIATLTPGPVRLRALPKIPPVARDIALVIAENVPYGQIQQVIEQAGKPILEQAVLFDVYKGKQIPPGKKSLAFRLSYSAGDRTLTDAEIAEAHQKIVRRLEQELQASLR